MLKVEIKELAKQLMEVEQTVEKNASVEIQLLKVEIKELTLQLGEVKQTAENNRKEFSNCLLYTSPSPRDRQKSRMPSSA